jgi:threonine efflux protein
MSLFALSLIHLVAVASPGPGFAVLFRHTISYSIKNGMITAVGIACGDLTLILISVFGAGYLVHNYPYILKWIQIGGAVYLTYLGFQAFRIFFKFIIHGPPEEILETPKNTSNYRKSFLDGFATTLSNPKAVVYFISISSQFMKSGQSNFDLFLLIFTLIFISFTWFSFVALFIGSPMIRLRFMKYRFYIDGLMGVVMVLFGIYFLMQK